MRTGTCNFCGHPKAVLVARLAADEDQRVCEACHADPRLPTIEERMCAHPSGHGEIIRELLSKHNVSLTSEAEIIALARAELGSL